MANSKVAILTNFMDFSPGYSLTGIVQDQCKMLQDNGHPVKLFVNSQYKLSEKDKIQFSHNVSTPDLPPVEVYNTIPFSHLVDYVSKNDLSDYHKDIAKETELMLLESLNDVEYVFTHDFIFTGWFLPYGLGAIEASKSLPNTKFFHWIHSTPTAGRDWWNFNAWGGNHKIIFPNKMEQVRVAEQYKTMPNNVGCIHHIKDLRTWNDFSQDANDFISDCPRIMSSDIVQIYPVSSDRFGAKRLDFVFEIFGHFKKMEYSVFLVVANQWATGRQRKEDVAAYVKKAESNGLEYGKDFVFTSLWRDGKFDLGINKRMLRDLASCSNMFIFPTREESFGLVGVEIPLSTSALMVTNRSLQMMAELHGNFTPNFHFGSFDHDFSSSDFPKYLNDVSILIHCAFKNDQAVLHRTLLRQKYNWSYLYAMEYLPLMKSNNL